MKRTRNITFLAILLIVLAVAVVGVINNYLKSDEVASPYNQPLAAAPETEDPLAGMAADYSVDQSFSSHLPLVIIDTGDVRPPISTVYNAEEDRHVSIPGVEPYVPGSIKIIDTGGMNTLADEAEMESIISIRRRGNTSMAYKKAQYLIKLVTESGQDNDVAVLGMGAEHEWVLNGSMADKSLMRNYLSYRTAGQFLPYTPDSVYCEVLYHENGKYYYEGVYLMTESIKQGENRIDIPEAKSSDWQVPYIVRRDRLDDDANTLFTWATLQDLSTEYITLLYPVQRNATDNNIRFVTEDLSRIERVLYSDDFSTYSTYSRYIDVESFIDYFIINEFLGNYDAGLHSTYMYKELGGKLHVGPVWDYDNALDNYWEEPLDLARTAFQTRPWFDRLMLDANFLTQLEERYAELRRGPLSNEAIFDMIDEIDAHLGGAVEREWHRWSEYYTTIDEEDVNYEYALYNYIDDYGDLMVRETKEFRTEVYRLKTSIVGHANAIGPRFTLLQKSTTTRTGISGYRGLVLLVAMLIFVIPSVHVSRK